jgi:CheY-like chemotaxis protein
LGRPLLFVDDEPDFLASMELLLGAHGYEVHPASDGNHALELLRNGLRPAAVLLDFRMPGMDGGQTLSQIRSLGIAVPAVLVSAVLDVERVAAHHGFDAALPKPLSIDDLLRVVNQLVP